MNTSNTLLQALKSSLEGIIAAYVDVDTNKPIFDITDPARFAILGLDNFVVQPPDNLYIRIHLDSMEALTNQQTAQLDWKSRQQIMTQNYKLSVKMHVHSPSDNPAGFGLEENLLWKFNNAFGLPELLPFTPWNTPVGRFKSKSFSQTQGDATTGYFHIFSFVLLVAKTVKNDIITYDHIDINYQQY